MQSAACRCWVHGVRCVARGMVHSGVVALAIVGSAGPLRAEPDTDLDARIVKLVGSVSEERLGATLKKLESFGTRSTLSSSTSRRRSGIGAARQWILDEMKSYSPKLQVSFDTYQVAKQGRITRDVEVRNVMAVLPGTQLRAASTSAGTTTRSRDRGGQGAANAGQRRRSERCSSPPADPNAPLDNLGARRQRRRQRHRADD